MSVMMRLRAAVGMAARWRVIGGQTRVDVGALEPTLWCEGGARIHDLVRELVQNGHEVRMTTNGSRLERFAEKLAETGLNALRTSWHTTNPTTFKAMSGGHGDYAAFRRGLEAAVTAGLPLTINRLLLRETLNELPEQIDFAEKHKVTLKLYDLLWTPGISDEYEKQYVGCEVAIDRYVQTRATEGVETGSEGLRKRERWSLRKGGTVEVKWGRDVERNTRPCLECPSKGECLEGWGEYVRFTPDRQIYLCYLRRDIGFDAELILKAAEGRGAEILRQELVKIAGNEQRAEAIIRKGTLRLTVSNACNFHCALPETGSSWCLEESVDTIMPPIRHMARGRIGRNGH